MMKAHAALHVEDGSGWDEDTLSKMKEQALLHLKGVYEQAIAAFANAYDLEIKKLASLHKTAAYSASAGSDPAAGHATEAGLSRAASLERLTHLSDPAAVAGRGATRSPALMPRHECRFDAPPSPGGGAAGPDTQHKCMSASRGTRDGDAEPYPRLRQRTGSLDLDNAVPLTPPIQADYELDATIGSGTYSKVQFGTDLKSGERVAVKVLYANMLTSEMGLRLMRQVRVLMNLHHPGISDYLGVYHDSLNYYIVTQYVDGIRLGEQMDEITFYSEDKVRNIIRQVVAALAYLHENKVSHGDIKPEKIYLKRSNSVIQSKTMQPILIDFGVPKEYKQVMLFPHSSFAAPETMQDEYEISPAADMWSVGVVTYFMIEGNSPFQANDTKATVNRLTDCTYNFNDPKWAAVSDAGKEVVRRLIVKDPAKRMTAHELLSHRWMAPATRCIPSPMVRPKKNLYTDYEVGSVIGTGAFSKVRAGVSKLTGNKVAIKAIRNGVLRGPHSDKLKREVVILSRLHHPNIVSLVDVYQDNTYHYIITELVEGKELFERIVQKGHYTEAEAKNVLVQLARAVEYLHNEGIAHRDLKPENLMTVEVDGKELVKVTDFGISKDFKKGSAMYTGIGSPGYVAPEVLSGEVYGQEVDMWSTGVILYSMLAGYSPFFSKDPVVVYENIVNVRFNFDDPVWETVSDDAKEVITLLLKRDPKERPTATQLLQHRWLRDVTV